MATHRTAPSSTSPISFPPSASTSTDTNKTAIQPTSSSTSPLVPASTIYKLLIFTIAMFTLPLLSYFASIDILFSGNSSYAGGLAALVANLVLGGYIVAAVREDAGDAAREEEKKLE